MQGYSNQVSIDTSANEALFSIDAPAKAVEASHPLLGVPSPLRVRGESSTAPEDHLVTFEFSGKIGVDYAGDSGRITKVNNHSQAIDKGVQVGWKICRIDDSPYSKALFVEKRSEGTPYQVTFQLPPPAAEQEQPRVDVNITVPLLEVCPWDSLAQFLTLPELERFCCTSGSHFTEFTIDEDTTQKEESALARVSGRKLLAPLLVLQVDTAEAVLERVSLANVRAVRVWNHRCLDMFSEAVSDAGGHHILKFLEKVALKGCPLYPEVISSFVLPVFSHSPLLKHLNLEKNQVTDDILCNLVSSGALDSGSLESMNLRFNRIGSRGVQALASSKCCASLKWVNLKMNQVGDEGAIALAEMLHGNTSMSLLNLRRQTPPLTDSTAFAFASALKNNSALEQLRLRQNRICDGGAAALAAEVAGHVQRLQSFRGVGAKFELDLEQNRIKESGALALLESLTGVSKSVRVELLIHGNWVKRADLQKVDADVAVDTRLAFDSKSEGLLW